MRIIDRVDELLDKKGLTGKQLAQSIGISPGNVTDWRKDRSKPSADVVAKIAKYLGVSTDYLFGNTPTESFAAVDSDTGYDLPPEALAELEQYKEFLLQKYGKK